MVIRLPCLTLAFATLLEFFSATARAWIVSSRFHVQHSSLADYVATIIASLFDGSASRLQMNDIGLPGYFSPKGAKVRRAQKRTPPKRKTPALRRGVLILTKLTDYCNCWNGAQVLPKLPTCNTGKEAEKEPNVVGA
jgi:hypothetical protein